MTVRIGWDEYEVALLIDACNRIRDNKIDKAECVHKLSNLLRQRAKANGINIDEVFRNENGIALQMTKMEYLLTDGKKGLPGASKLYIEMAKMSKLMLSRLVDTFFSRTSWTMLLYAENHSISVA